MRFAELVNHRIFERKWRSREILRACLFECPLKKTLNLSVFYQIIFCRLSYAKIYFGVRGIAAVGCVRGRRDRHAVVTLNLVRQGLKREMKSVAIF